MRRALALGVLMAALAAEPALALAPGAPRHVRTARAADAQPRPGALAEDWMLELVDPRSKTYMGLRIFRSPDEVRGVRLELSRGGQGYVADDIAFAPSIARRQGIWTIRFSSARSVGEIRLARARPGVTAQRWQLGREAGFAEHVTMSWATPVATARVSGRVRVGTRSVDLGGWRGSLEHRWGTFSRDWRAWDHAGTALVHTRAGSAWMLLGVNRRDFLTGPGARDAFWLGLLVRATPSGTSVCRPRIVRRGWLTSIDGPAAVTRISASCPGRRVRFRRIADTALPGNSFGGLGDESRARARPGGAAWIRYAGHPIF
jgi:hypothetical protein